MTMLRTLAAVVLVALPAACTAVSTYPPTAGTTKQTPNVSPGPEVMAGAIREAARATGTTGGIVFNLPAGLDDKTWNWVERLLPEGARRMQPGDTEAISVQQLRVSGGTAEVDVVYPERGVYQMMTVRFTGGPFQPYRVASAYRWRIPSATPIASAPNVAPTAVD